MAAPAGLKLNGPAIREIRMARGLTVSQCASEASVGQGTWSNWEAGRRGATAENVQRISEILLITDVRAILQPSRPVTTDDVESAA